MAAGTRIGRCIANTSKELSRLHRGSRCEFRMQPSGRKSATHGAGMERHPVFNIPRSVRCSMRMPSSPNPGVASGIPPIHPSPSPTERMS